MDGKTECGKDVQKSLFKATTSKKLWRAMKVYALNGNGTLVNRKPV